MHSELFDTHCHIQSIGADSADFTAKKWRDGEVDNADEVVESARQTGVTRLLCVGTDLADSERAVDFVGSKENCWAAVGVHPHEAKDYANSPDKLQLCSNLLDENKVVAVGEVGLDFYYEHSPKADQVKLLEWFLQLAVDKNLPVILHVRDAHADFWPIFDNFKSAGQRIRGVMHSFSATTREMDEALKRDLSIGLNGIMTFTHDDGQLAAAKAVPLDRLFLETDAPYLTPKPHRGKICKPKHVYDVAKFLSELRKEKLETLSSQTTKNACELFNIAN